MSAARPGSGRVPALDGVRALAVGLVFVAHAGYEKSVPGGLGVTLFFVLSGFLITTLMRQELARTGTISLPRFYLRRLLRLGPTLTLVVLATALLSAAGWVSGAFSAGGLAAALFYGGNYFVIATDFHGLPAGLGVIWSLAVEEHFYLLFPWCALALLRQPVRRQCALLAGGCLAVLAWRCLLVSRGVSEAWTYMATDCRIDAILIGCLLAVGANPWLEPPPGRTRERVGLQVAIGLGVLAGTLLVRHPAFRETLRYTLQAGAAAMLLRAAVLHPHSRWFAWLEHRWLRYLGGVSYTIYLVHHVVLLALPLYLPAWPQAARMVLGALVTLAICEPVRRFVDLPSERIRRRLHEAQVAAITPQGELKPCPRN